MKAPRNLRTILCRTYTQTCFLSDTFDRMSGSFIRESGKRNSGRHTGCLSLLFLPDARDGGIR